VKTRTLIASVAVAGALILAPAVPATAASPAATGVVMTKVVSFKNCTALHKKYPGGVAKAGVKYNLVSGKKKAFKVKPKISTALYKANKSLDRDKDGIACEK
jgi:hypothetical protein